MGGKTSEVLICSDQSECVTNNKTTSASLTEDGNRSAEVNFSRTINEVFSNDTGEA